MVVSNRLSVHFSKGGELMNAIKEAQKFIAKNPSGEDAKTLALLVFSLGSKEPFPLERLYELEMKDFELAMEVMREWRLDRYFAGKSKLYDMSLQVQQLS